MQEVTLYISTPDGQRNVKLDQEITIGRTDQAQLVINDSSLSRVHATIFREGDEVWVLDENSSNGTFVNGQKVAPEKKLNDGDEILLGSNTRIYVEIAGTRKAASSSPNQSNVKSNSVTSPPPPAAQTPQATAKSPAKELPMIPIIGAASIFFIIIVAVVAVVLTRPSGNAGNSKNGSKPTPVQISAAVIPIRVIDPLGGEDPDDLDDFITSWEGEEEELKAENIEEIKADETISDPTKRTELVVKVEFWKQQRDKSLSGAGSSQGLVVPAEMSGRGFANQLRKVAQLRDRDGYKVPLDFSDLAESYLKGTLVELPIATNTYVLDVGGSASDVEFTEFDFDKGNLPIAPGSPKYNSLKQLADKLGYSLDNPAHRKQLRMRLLRMYNPKSRPILEAICAAFYERFKVPLRITSLTRSMDYQIGLNKSNGNSYKVRDRNATPPHTSGCAFDIGRNHLSGEAQNFLMARFSELEKVDKIDSLIEGNVNACFHTFIYPDGVGPNGSSAQTKSTTQPKPKPTTPTKPAAPTKSPEAKTK